MTVLSVTLVYSGQAVGWIKMKLGMEVGLGPGTVPDFGPCLLWPNCWMDQDFTCYGGRPRPRRHCIKWGPSSHLEGAQPSNFWPMSIVAKRLDGSRWHLVRRYTSAQATLCSRGPSSPAERGSAFPPIFGPCLLWLNGRPSQLLLSSCIEIRSGFLEPPGIEICPFPLLWLLAFTTACTPPCKPW